MNLRIPQALIEEHRTILAKVEKAEKEGGEVGEAARALMAVLRPHIERDNAVVLPTLSLLSVVVNDQSNIDLSELSGMLDSVRTELPHMASEHKTILATANRLAEAARHEDKKEYISFAFQIWLHMDEEEAVYYPAAQLVAAVLRIREALVFSHKTDPQKPV
jgi:hypothetical protein